MFMSKEFVDGLPPARRKIAERIIREQARGLSPSWGLSVTEDEIENTLPAQPLSERGFDL
jgi:hypothetical protein